MQEYKFVDKYHPKTINDMVLSKEILTQFKSMLEKNQCIDMTLAGNAGIGKTTLADIIAKTLNATVLFIPCGLKGNIDTVRNEIKVFTEALDLEDRIKLIILDEADQLSSIGESNAQKALRSLMSEESNKNVYWILTCNYPNKIISPIKSRCPIVNLTFTAKDLAQRVVYILEQEKIKYTKKTLKEFIDIVLKKHYPDIRKIINILQQCTITGELKPIDIDSQTDEYDAFVTKLMDQFHSTSSSLRTVMHDVEENKSIFNGDYVGLACRILKEESELFTIKRVEKLCECIYRMGVVADPSVQFCGFICIMLNKEYNKEYNK